MFFFFIFFVFCVGFFFQFGLFGLFFLLTEIDSIVVNDIIVMVPRLCVKLKTRLFQLK